MRGEWQWEKTHAKDRPNRHEPRTLTLLLRMFYGKTMKILRKVKSKRQFSMAKGDCRADGLNACQMQQEQAQQRT
jgi:hypothetical protein